MFGEVLYKSDYLLITYDKDDKFIYAKWLPDVINLDEEEFKKEMLHFLEAFDKTGYIKR